jgi:hypothetical protein
LSAGRRWLHVAPRAAGILAILYLSVFALDVFRPGEPWPSIVVALAIHLIPSAALVVVLAIAWRAELVGGVLFILVSLLPFATLGNPFWVNLLLAAPFTLTGALFVAEYWMRR